MPENVMNNTSKTDWEKIDALTEAEINTSDIPPLTEEFFRQSRWWPIFTLYQAARKEERILMGLPPTDPEWDKRIEQIGFQLGLRQAIEQERRATIMNLMRLRYGGIDPALEAIMPQLVSLENAECMRLLLQLSKAELIQHCQRLS
jgi:hypothetical protein